MRIPTYGDSFQVLLLQAADQGRGPVLFGESQARARAAVPPFLIGNELPDIYFEHPLIGDPFLDVTVLFGKLDPGTRVDSPLAGDHGTVLDWFAETSAKTEGISCGFELDTHKEQVPEAAMHFQPRKQTGLVQPFFDAIGEPGRAETYLGTAARMPEGWPLSFFGLFRGRPGTPLRVCGYLDHVERKTCVDNPEHLASAFDAIGFSAYDDAMLAQVAEIMAAAPGTVDFQFDVFPDGSLGSVFALDVQFGIGRPEAVATSFASGPGARVMNLLQGWDVADERWKLAVQAAFARAVAVELDGGGTGRYAFTLMPQWVKVRWANGRLQPAKLYHLGNASLLGNVQ